MCSRGRNAGPSRWIFRRNNGRGYRGKLTLGPGSYKWFSGKTWADVDRRIDEAVSRLQAGLPAGSPSMSVAELLTLWLNASGPNVRASTYRGYSSHCRTHLIPRLGHVRLTDLRPAHVQTLVNDLTGSGLSPRTVHRVHATLRQALNLAVRWDIVERNVASLVALPKATRYEAKHLSAREARELLAALQERRMWPFYATLLGLGLRSGEARGLLWTDLDLDGGVARIRRSLQRGPSGCLELGPPKSPTAVRDLSIPGFVKKALIRQRANQAAEREKAGEKWVDSGLVFTTKHGKPLDGSNVENRWLADLERAGLPRMRLHDLRHTTASLLKSQTGDVVLIKEFLGHSQISLTADTYVRTLTPQRVEASEKLNQILSGDGGPE